MSDYGPPGGQYPGQSPEPYPGQPADPWIGRPPTDPYGQPVDPWGGQDQWGGSPVAPPSGDPGTAGGYQAYPQTSLSGYGSSQRYEPAYPTADPEPAWSPAGPLRPEEKKSNAPLIALVVTLVVLVFGGGAAAVYLVDRNAGPGKRAGGTPATTGGPTATTSPTPAEPPSTPAPENSTDARFVKVGQCVKNEGSTEGRPKLAITRCGPKTYEVLQRFDGATSGKEDATTKCSKVEGYTDWYFFNSELDVFDFVLCLKLR